jgi:glycosyltransferase involved in cell wall biosynthesis/O-antigen/teichoic acid export membrane protein
MSSVTRATVRPSRGSRLSRGLLPAQLREYSRGVAPLLIAMSALNASNYVFHVAISRLLGPTSYGALTALLALMLVVSVPFGVLQATIAKRTAIMRAEENVDEVPDLAAGTLKLVLPVAGLIFLAFIVLSPVIAVFLRVSIGAAILVGAYVLVSLTLSVPLGALQGLQRFRALAMATMIGVVARFAVGVGLVWLGLGVPGALIGSVLAQGVAFVGAWKALGVSRGMFRRALPEFRLLRDDFLPTLLGLSAFWLLAEGDVVLGRHFLGTAAAGYYSSAEVLARALLFVPGAIAIVALPRFTELRRSPSELRHFLRISLAAVGVLEAIGLSVLVLARVQVVGLAFGNSFAPAASIVPLLSIGTGLMAVVFILTYFHLAIGTRAHFILFGGLVVQSTLIVFFHGSPSQIAGMVVIATGLTAVVLFHAARAAIRWTPPMVAAPMPVGGSPEHRLSVVLPCHNADAGLPEVLAGLRDELHEIDHEIVVVSDGCTDRTVEIARSFGVRVIEYPDRGGKGHALRVGLAEARGEYVAFMDSDGDISPRSIRPFLSIMELFEPDIVLGSKRHPLSEIDYPPLRRVLSWTYHKITRLLFRVNVRDTQTGVKLLRRDVLAAVLPRMLEKRYAFDLELLVIAKRLGYTRFFEAPIKLEYRFSSQIDPRAAGGILKDTIGVFYRRYVLNTYGSRSRALLEPNERVAVSIGRGAGRLRVETLARSVPRPLRILVVNWRDIRNPDAGGAEVYTHEVTRRWAAAGHEVWLLASRFPGARSMETIDGVRVRRMGRLRNGTFHLLVQRDLAKLEGFDVVLDEINTIPFFTPLWRNGLPPAVALIHQLAEDVWDAELPRPLARLGRAIEPHMLGWYRDTPVVTVSESTRAGLLGLGLNDVLVVPQGRDDPPDVASQSKEGVPTFLFVGRLASNKRPDHAVAAFRTICARLPQARLWIVGRGPMEKQLRKQLPEGAELLGYLPRQELYERMARAHCLLVPSVQEGWGMVVTEANGVGTPAVGYDVPGIREAIQHGKTGLLAPAGDPRSLANAALRVISDPAGYASMRNSARVWAAGFTWDQTAKLLLEVLAEHAGVSSTEVAAPAVSDEREEAPRELIVSVG